MTVNHDESFERKVVISGISGRFPNSDNFVQLQENLLNKVDCTTEDHGRWKYDTPLVPQCIGKVNRLESFDRLFFGVHAKLTENMDPSSRILLENCFEAIMDAGINPKSLKGANIAVYSSTNLSESEKAFYLIKGSRDGFALVGCSKAMFPNRISFFLGFNGSSVAVDSACAGTATALELAYRAIKNGHCDGALVTGSIVGLHPHISYQLRALGLLSSDGKTRSFDDNADGHTRSDGSIALFLQRQSDARRNYMEVVDVRSVSTGREDHDPILYPKPETQIKLMKELLSANSVSPDDIAFLEASGVGLRQFDAEELEAIDEVFKDRKEPLLVGSIKSNIGDAGPANAANSVVKMIAASETGKIPPNIHYNTPNAEATGLVEGRIKIPTDVIPWTRSYSIVNCTSNTGIFSSILLKAPELKGEQDCTPDDNLPRLVIISGRTEEAINTILDFVEQRPVHTGLLQMLYDIFQTDIDAHLCRGYTILPAQGVLGDSKKRELMVNSGEKRQVWWIFSGMGSQWTGMGEALLKLPAFELAIRKCDKVLKPLGYDIYNVISEKDPKMFDNIINSFIGIAAIQIGLVDVLRSVGLEPDYIIGHSVGELGCAYADGCFTAEQMVLAALSRGIASTEVQLIKGSMAAVGLGYDDIKPLCPPDIDVACHNGPESSTISGPAESMKVFVADLTAKGIFAREVPCSNIAYHSRYIAAAGPVLMKRLEEVIPKPNPRSSKWVSSSVPRAEWTTMRARLSSAEYHTNNLLSPVLFDETSRLIPPKSICVEIAPHGLLQAILKRSLHQDCINIPLTRRGHPDNLEVLLAGLGKMYNIGLQPQISNLYPKFDYPVPRGTPSIAPLIKWDHSVENRIILYAPVLNKKKRQQNIEINLAEESNKFYRDTVMDGKLRIPLTLCWMKVWEIFKSLDTESAFDVIFEDIKVFTTLIQVPDNNVVEINMMLAHGTGKFEVSAHDILITSGTVKSTKAAGQELLEKFNLKNDDVKYDMTAEDFYTEMRMRGYKYPEEFKTILKTTFDGTNALINWNDDWTTFIDGALQLYTFGNDTRREETPISIRKLIIDATRHETAVQSGKAIDIFVDRKLNYISAGGLEIQGLKLEYIPKTLKQNRFSNNTLSTVQNTDVHNDSLSDTLQLILQIVNENIFSNKKQKIQLINNNSDEIIANISTELYNVPETTHFKVENIDYEKATFKTALTIMSGIPENYSHRDIAHKLGESKFLSIVLDNSEKKVFINSAESLGLKIIFQRTLAEQSILLVRKKFSVEKLHVLNITNGTEDMVRKIKNIRLTSNRDRVMLILSKDATNNDELWKKLKDSVDLERVRLYFINDRNLSSASFSEQFLSSQAELDLLVNIFINHNSWATLRLVNIHQNPRECSRWFAGQIASHDPSSISWKEKRRSDRVGSEVKVEYACLNNQDVLIANGAFNVDSSETGVDRRLQEINLGLEYSGTDSKGNRVMGVTCGNALSNFVEPDSLLTWPVPKSWSLEDAATIPLSYAIAYSSVVMKANAQTGEKVMISSTCDGIGLAVLQLALQRNCDVFVLYETENERHLILSMYPKFPLDHLFRSSKTFRDDVLLRTKGQEMDVIICNQCEIKEVELYFTIAKRNARVVFINDLMHNNIHESVGMEIFLKEINLYSVVPRKILLSNKETKKLLSNMLRDDLNAGFIKPLPRNVYSRDSLNKAFKICSKRKPLGKIVVEVQPKERNAETAPAIPSFYCDENKSYLIIEGLTNFGLELIDWLVVKGAKNIVIASTAREIHGYVNYRLNLWRRYGVKIDLQESVSLSQEKQIDRLFDKTISFGSIDAIFDLQRIDTANDEQSPVRDTLTGILDSKCRKMCPELRLFAVFDVKENLQSSTTLGKLESNYVGRDQKLLRIMEKRKADGLKSLLIRWGVNGVPGSDSISLNDDVLPPASEYLRKLDELLDTDEFYLEVSYILDTSNEIEEQPVDDEEENSNVCNDDLESFRRSLYESSDNDKSGVAFFVEAMV